MPRQLRMTSDVVGRNISHRGRNTDPMHAAREIIIIFPLYVPMQDTGLFYHEIFTIVPTWALCGFHWYTHNPDKEKDINL